MLGAKGVMYFMLLFIILGLFSSICNLAWYGAEETQQFRWLTTIMDTGISLKSVPGVTAAFFTEGIPALITWDYSFLRGTSWGELVRFIAFVITALGFVWTIIVVVLPVAAAAVGGLAGGLISMVRR